MLLTQIYRDPTVLGTRRPYAGVRVPELAAWGGGDCCVGLVVGSSSLWLCRGERAVASGCPSVGIPRKDLS